MESNEVGVGYVWVGWFRNLYLFPTFAQNYVWSKSPYEGRVEDESFIFQTTEGMAVNADIGVTFHIDPAKVTTLFQKYRKGIDEIRDIYLRNEVRDGLNNFSSTMTVDDIYGKGKVSLLTNVENYVRTQMNGSGIVLDRLYWVGTVRLPEPVVAALNAKIQATQMAQQRENEVAQARAEAQKLVEGSKGEAQSQVAKAEGNAKSIMIEAQARADANILLAKSLTPDLVKLKAIERWSGAVPTYSGSGTVPFIDLNPGK